MQCLVSKNLLDQLAILLLQVTDVSLHYLLLVFAIVHYRLLGHVYYFLEVLSIILHVHIEAWSLILSTKVLPWPLI